MIDFESDDFAAGTPLPTIMDGGLSRTVRPGTLSYDYLVAYTLGPVQQGDFSLGLANRIWRVRFYNQSISIERENDTKSGFESPTTLTAIPFQPAEGDAAFDQSARLFVCLEFNQHVWFYWFKPAAGTFVFEDFGPGHSPRCTLDQLTNRDDSDLHVFYLREGILYYRVQRENYAVEHSTGYVAAQTSFVEDVAITKGGRVVALIANMGIDGHYTYELTFSKLLPYLPDLESVFEGFIPTSGILLILLQTVAPLADGANFVDDVEQYHEIFTVISGDLHLTLISNVLFDIEQWHEGLTVQSGALPVVVIDHILFDIEQYHEGFTVNSGLLVVVVIVHVLFDIEQWHEGFTVLSGTLV